MHLAAEQLIGLRRAPTRFQPLLDLAHLPLEPRSAERLEAAAPFLQGRGGMGQGRDPGQKIPGVVADFRAHPRISHLLSLFHQAPDALHDLGDPAALQVLVFDQLSKERLADDLAVHHRPQEPRLGLADQPRAARHRGRGARRAQGLAALPHRVLQRLQDEPVFDAEDRRQILDPARPAHRVVDLRQERQHRVQRLDLPFRRRQVDPARGLAGQVLDARRGRLQALAIPLDPVLPDVQVGVLPRGERHDLHLEAVLQQDLEAPPRRRPARRVGVEVHHHAVGVSLQEPYVARREAGAERPDRLLDAGLVEGDDVHVPFHQDRVPFFAHRLAGEQDPVEVLALAERRRLRRVQVFRLSLPDHPAAEPDGLGGQVQDREDHPLAEPIVRPARLFLLRQEAGQHRLVFRDALRQVPFEAAPPLGGIADLEPIGRLPRDAASRKVLTRPVPARFPVLLPEVAEGALVRRQHLLALAALPRSRPAGRRQRDVVAACERPEGLGELHLLVQHQELEDVPTGPAAEAIEELFVRVHVERRGLLRVERTKGPVLRPAALLEREIVRNDLAQIRRGPHDLDRVRPVSRSHGAFKPPPGPAIRSPAISR